MDRYVRAPTYRFRYAPFRTKLLEEIMAFNLTTMEKLSVPPGSRIPVVDDDA